MDQDLLDFSLEGPTAPPTIPAGVYHLKVVDAELKLTKSGGGQYINYRATIMAGEHAGKSIFGMWTIKNAAGKNDATWRTRGDFKRLGYTPPNGVPALSSIKELEGTAKVTEEDKTDSDGETTGEKENRIRKWIGTV